MIKGSTGTRVLAGLAIIARSSPRAPAPPHRPRRRARRPQPAASEPASSEPSGSAPASQAAKQYKIGYSNGGGVGNGFREEQVCTAKAEALASGQVSELTTIHRNTDANGQLQDIRDLIAAGVDAIIFNPNDPDALTPALDEAKAAGIITVSVDQFVNHADTLSAVQQPGQVRRARRQVAVRQARRHGHRLLPARLRRRRAPTRIATPGS